MCACARVCTPRMHAPPPRRRKAQLRDVSHLDRKSRLVTAAWRCTRAPVLRAGAPPPIEKAVAEVERIASMGVGGDEGEGGQARDERGQYMTETLPRLYYVLTVRTFLFQSSTVRGQPSRGGVALMRARQHTAPRCAVRQYGRVDEHLVGRLRVEDAPVSETKACKASQPHPARPLGRGWLRLAAPRCRCPGHPLALPKPARRHSGPTWAGLAFDREARWRRLELARMGEHDVIAARPLRDVVVPGWLGPESG